LGARYAYTGAGEEKAYLTNREELHERIEEQIEEEAAVVAGTRPGQARLRYSQSAGPPMQVVEASYGKPVTDAVVVEAAPVTQGP
jgi:hypothetical protein